MAILLFLLSLRTQAVTVQHAPVHMGMGGGVSNKSSSLLHKDSRALLVKRDRQEVDTVVGKGKKIMECFEIVKDVPFPKSDDVAGTVAETYTCIQFPFFFSKEKCCQYCPMKMPVWVADKCKTPNPSISKARITFWKTGPVATTETQPAVELILTDLEQSVKLDAGKTGGVTWFTSLITGADGDGAGGAGTADHLTRAQFTTALTALATGASKGVCQKVHHLVNPHDSEEIRHITGQFSGTHEMASSVRCQCTQVGSTAIPCLFYSDDACATALTEDLVPFCSTDGSAQGVVVVDFTIFAAASMLQSGFERASTAVPATWPALTLTTAFATGSDGACGSKFWTSTTPNTQITLLPRREFLNEECA